MLIWVNTIYQSKTVKRVWKRYTRRRTYLTFVFLVETKYTTERPWGKTNFNCRYRSFADREYMLLLSPWHWQPVFTHVCGQTPIGFVDVVINNCVDCKGNPIQACRWPGGHGWLNPSHEVARTWEVTIIDNSLKLRQGAVLQILHTGAHNQCEHTET